MLGVEILKIFKRRFNYIYFFMSIILVGSMQYLKNLYHSLLGVTREEFFYNYTLKMILVMVIIFIVMNLTFSYKKDYSDGISKLIYHSRTSGFGNLFSKMLVNYVTALFYYMLLLFYELFMMFYLDNINLLVSRVLVNNLVLVAVILFFVVNLVTIIMVTFDNVHIIFPLTVLVLTFPTFIRNFVKEHYRKQISGDIFSESFMKISNQALVETLSMIQLFIYGICMFCIALIVKWIKDN